MTIWGKNHKGKRTDWRTKKQCHNFRTLPGIQDYHVIEKIEVLDENFSPEPIFFNDNLTCIIGGKSTGKSLLLHNMALTLDQEQVQEKDGVAKTNVRAISGMKIYWRDGSNTSPKDTPRKIVYVPQTYLNRLSDEREETTAIDCIVQENRSIFDELIQFIKSKKKNRQIIVVTHNANIVLGGDAELVIIANRDGKNAPNSKGNLSSNIEAAR